MYLGKTYFSLKYGTYSTKGLVKGAVDAGATSLVLTNVNATCDAWDFVQYCREEGIKPILGAEIRNDNALLYIILAANNRGFGWINAYLSDHAAGTGAFTITILTVSWQAIRAGRLNPVKSLRSE